MELVRLWFHFTALVYVKQNSFLGDSGFRKKLKLHTLLNFKDYRFVVINL